MKGSTKSSTMEDYVPQRLHKTLVAETWFLIAKINEKQNERCLLNY